MKLQVIGPWLKPKGFDLYLCDVFNPMFDINLMLCFGSLKEFSRYILEREEYVVESKTALAMYVYTNKNDKRSNYLIFTENEWCAKDYGTIAHELHHFTHFALDAIGVTYGIGGEELYSYFQGYYMELCVLALNELQKSLNKKKKK